MSIFSAPRSLVSHSTTGAGKTITPASRAPLAERSAVNRQVLGSIPSGGELFCDLRSSLPEPIKELPFAFKGGKTSLWPNWIRRLTTNQKIEGSSPFRDSYTFFNPFLRNLAHTLDRKKNPEQGSQLG